MLQPVLIMVKAIPDHILYSLFLEDGFQLLGAPVGSLEYEEESRLASVIQLLDMLQTLQEPHMEYTLLRSCLSFSKMVYAMQTVDML